MKEFNSIPEAFEWFLENVYPDLTTPEKRILRDAKYGFYKEGKTVSEKRMKKILSEYGIFEIVYRFSKKN